MNPLPPSAREITGLGTTVPGWTLRVAVLVAGSLLVLTVPGGRWLGLFDLVPAAVLLLLAAGAPGGPLPGLFLLVVAVAGLATRDPSSAVQLWRLPLVAALFHAVHTLCALAGGVPLAARLEVAVLDRPIRRWLLAQAVAAPVLVGVGALMAARSGAAPVDGSWILGAGLLAVAICCLPALLLRAATQAGSEATPSPTGQVAPVPPRPQ